MPLRDPGKYSKYQKIYQLKRYHARRQEAIENLGGKCVACGTTENLELDHIDPSTKSFPISKLWSISKAKFLEELAKCQLLCNSCHIIKSKQDNKKPITHGKYWATYKHKCICEECMSYRISHKIEKRSKYKG